ncbi:MAG: CRISPR-associated Cas2 family protein [Stygiobacter sp.]|nr:MAG: CRISPR-associated Cas2 family protein [Stygiobacter sp.]KAF0215416.1 MAG: CRISPR-associated Cas2 family [Ignavibacteria bacterium]
MIYVITYDIDDDKQRYKISKLLEEYGVRVQESVFECNLNTQLYDKLLNKLVAYANDGVNIRIYPVCKECFLKAVGMGNLKYLPGLKGYEIV